MKPANRYVIFRFALAYASGIAIAHTLAVAINCQLIGLAVLIPLFIYFYWKGGRPGQNWMLELMAGLIILNLGSIRLNQTQQKGQYSHQHLATAGNQLISLRVQSTLKPTTFYRSWVAQLQSLGARQTHGKLLLRSKISDSLMLDPDDELILYAGLTPISGPKNPGQFDFRNYWALKQVMGEIRLEPQQILSHKAGKTSWSGNAHRLRRALIRKLEVSGLEKPQLAVTKAMLLGDRRGIDSELRLDFQQAGAMHLLAISGLHVGIIYAILTMLTYPLRWLKYGRLIQTGLVVMGILGFAWITGFSASVSRASLLVIGYSVGRTIGRSLDSTHLLGLVFFGLLVYRPMWLFDLGFQLSFTAVIGILWLSPPLNKLLRTNWPLLIRLRALLVVSLTAQIGVLPMSLYYFHQFSGAFLLSSLLVLPALGLVLLMGLAVIILAYLDLNLEVLTNSYNFVLGGVLQLIQLVGKWGYWKQDIAFTNGMMISSYAVLIWGCWWMYKNGGLFRKLFLSSCMAFIVVVLIGRSKPYADSFHVLHQSGQSLIAIGHQQHMRWISTDTASNVNTPAPIRNLSRIMQIRQAHQLPYQTLFTWQDKTLLIIDSLGVYTSQIKADWILLTYNPKVNLQRLIDSVQPQLIVADGTNWPSMANLWRETCHKNKLRFHYTGKSGAFIYKPE